MVLALGIEHPGLALAADLSGDVGVHRIVQQEEVFRRHGEFHRNVVRAPVVAVGFQRDRIIARKRVFGRYRIDARSGVAVAEVPESDHVGTVRAQQIGVLHFAGRHDDFQVGDTSVGQFGALVDRAPHGRERDGQYADYLFHGKFVLKVSSRDSAPANCATG